jgi:transcriptional regulator with XRE-family HTH domain
MARRRWPEGTYMKLRDPQALREKLKDHHLSGAQVADHAGVSRSFISHMLAGRKKTCSDEVAERIAEVLHIPSTDLFDPRQSADGRRIVIPRTTNIRTPRHGKVAA